MFPESLLLTCEHASPRVPARYKSTFASSASQDALRSHRGYDLGAAALAQALSRQANLGLQTGEMTRLLIDLNRTRNHPALFSEWSKQLADERKRELLMIHKRHTENVEASLRKVPTHRRAYHLAVHSFTPVLDGKKRTTDIGLLYDPSRAGESEWVMGFAQQLRTLSELRVHKNRPYRGTSDGLTTHLRGKFGNRRYAGLELEINQRLVTRPADVRALARLLDAALAASLSR